MSWLARLFGRHQSLIDQVKHMPIFGVDAFPVEITEEVDYFLLRVLAPGMDKDKWGLSVEDRVVQLYGEKKAELDKIKSLPETFQTAKEFPVAVDPVGATVSYVDGVLTITMPKARLTPRRVSLQIS